MANHVDAIGEITIFTIQFLCQPNCVCSRAYIRTPGLFGMLCVFSFPINIRDCGNALCGQFFKQEKMADNCDDGDFDLPSITPKRESTCSSESIESLLGIDARISQVDRDFFLRFFQSLGFATLPNYLRTSLEAYQKKHGYEAAKSGAMRATLGRLLKRLEEKAPSNGIGTGKKAALPSPQQQPLWPAWLAARPRPVSQSEKQRKKFCTLTTKTAAEGSPEAA